MEFMKAKTLNEAQEILFNSLDGYVLEAEKIALSKSLGRIIANDQVMEEDLPSFSRSTVDGFAVRSSDIFVAGEGIPVVLDNIGEILMGRTTELTLAPGQAANIPTGGMLPFGADAVVMIEYTEKPDEKTVLVVKPVAPGENVISKGEDMRSGTVIVHRGERIGVAQIGALAACGFAEISVRKQPRIGILSTGDEVVDIGSKPGGGQVRDINSYALAAMLEAVGCSAIRYGIIPDDYQQVLLALRQAVKETDMVLVSGGSSVGTRDYAVQAIAELGTPGVLLHGIAVKPGKPTIYGLIGHVPVFGLPGHPVSAMTICEQLVKPVIGRLLGRSESFRGRAVPARISRNIASAPGRDDFLRVRLRWKQDGYEAEPILGKSGLISTMLQADGIVHIDTDCGGLYAGDPVMVELI